MFKFFPEFLNRQGAKRAEEGSVRVLRLLTEVELGLIGWAGHYQRLPPRFDQVMKPTTPRAISRR
jgi:hypothetical protein